MELPDRLVRIHPLPGRGLLATDVTGRMHLLDDNLRLQRSSPAVPGGLPTYSLAVGDEFAVTKDRLGNVTKWRLDTLEPIVVLAAQELRAPDGKYIDDEEPSPVINRGIAIWRDRVYVNNGYMQVVVLDLDTFDVMRVAEPFSPVFLEWICTDRPGQQAVSDKTGKLYLGNLETLEFPIQVSVDEQSNVHRVLYDPIHDRFWAIQDAGDSSNYLVSNGLATILPDGTIEQILRFAADDIECLAFSADFTKAFTGGFDGDLHVFDNTSREVSLIRTVHEFSHEIIDLALLGDGNLAVLTQDGQLVRMTEEGVEVGRADFLGQCVWDIQPIPHQHGQFRLGTDTGIQTIQIREGGTGPNPVVIDDWRTGNGFVRSMQCTEDATFGVSHAGEVFCLDIMGDVVWRAQYSSRLHTVALNPTTERLLVASNEGAFEHESANGTCTANFELAGRHAWVACYLQSGERVIATHDFQILVFEAHGERLLWSIKLEGYPKRMRATETDLYVTGGGGVRQISLEERKVVRNWDTMLDNTVENFLFNDDYLYAISYGCQLAMYDADTTEGIGLIELLPDFAKGFALLSTEGRADHLLVGGRGGYLQVYRLLSQGEPALVRTVRIPR